MASTINAKTTGTGGIEYTGDASGNVAIQSDGTTVLNTTASGVEVTGTLQNNNVQVATQNVLGVRNLIINGDMRIAQRGTSATGKTTSGYYTCDRWNHVFSTAGTWTFTQDTDVPSGQGFTNSLKMACTTANASLSASSSFQLHHRFEGQNLQHLKKGTANAESVTLSFWIKSNKTGTYQVNIQDRDNTRMISSTYTIDSADTWEKKILTFAGDTTGAFDNDNNDSIRMAWFLASGSNYNTGSVPTSWEATDTTDIAAGLTVNLADSTSNYLNITGVQLEVGTEATPFEHRPYDMELARCQRYYEHNYNIGQTPGSVSTYPSGMGAWLNGLGTHSGQKGFQSDYKVTKRATPSVTFYDTAGNSARVSTLNSGGTTTTNQSIAIVMSGTSSILGVAGDGSHTGVHYFWVADSEL